MTYAQTTEDGSCVSLLFDRPFNLHDDHLVLQALAPPLLSNQALGLALPPGMHPLVNQLMQPRGGTVISGGPGGSSGVATTSENAVGLQCHLSDSAKAGAASSHSASLPAALELLTELTQNKK